MKKNNSRPAHERTEPPMKPFRFIIYIILAGILVAADQLSKAWVLTNETLQNRGEIPIIPNFFSFRYTFNTGAAFSFLADRPWGIDLLTILSGVAAVVFFIILLRKSGWPPLLPVSLMMVFAGTIGNGIDRFQMGGVVDFLDFYYQSWHFPTFNIADSLIVVGVILLLIYVFFLEDRHRKRYQLQQKLKVRPI